MSVRPFRLIKYQVRNTNTKESHPITGIIRAHQPHQSLGTCHVKIEEHMIYLYFLLIALCSSAAGRCLVGVQWNKIDVPH